ASTAAPPSSHPPARRPPKAPGPTAGPDAPDTPDEPRAPPLPYPSQPPRGSRDLPPDQLLPNEERTVLVYDLGGGTFDVTLVRLSHRRFQTLAIEGDVRLCGKDWDDRIFEYVATQLMKHHGDDPRKDAQSLAALTAAAERAKKTLSKLSQTSITCTHGGKVLTVPLTRAELEGLTRDLLTRTRLTTQQLLRQANFGWEKVDRLLLV